MKKVDLHIHTTASDGILSPTEVVDWAIKKGLSAIAITDHDTTLGIDEAIARSSKYKNFKVVPGIELSSDYNGKEIHILGYFIDYKNKKLIEETNRLKKSRIERGYKMVERLKEIGLDIDIEDVEKIADKGFVGRPHIARILEKKGYVETFAEAFEKYIGNGKPAYVNRHKLSIADSIELIHNSGGVAVLAHPGINNDNSIITKVRELGIDGIETIHSKHNKETSRHLYMIANSYDLICTGGSDCHGHIIDNKLILGEFIVDFKVVKELENKAKENYQG